MRITLANDTEGILNGIPVVFPRDTVVDFIEANSTAHVAELCSAGKLRIDLSHQEGDVMVRYGAGGKEFRDPIVPVVEEKPKAKAAVKVAPKVEKPKAAPKPTLKAALQKAAKKAVKKATKKAK